MKVNRNKIPLSIPFIDFNEKKLILDSIERNEISSYGQNVGIFEKRISQLTGGKFNLALNSGSSALIVAFKSIGLKKNDIVITQSYTFTATTNSIIHSGAVPWLFDIDNENLSIHVNKVRASLKKNCYKKGKFFFHKKTKKRVFAICPVFTLSIVPRIDEIKLLAKQFNLKIVFDAACALNAKFFKKDIVKYSDISTFSFNGNKSFTTGSGGLISTNNKFFFNKSKLISQNAKNKSSYIYSDIGYNLKMNNLNAAIGLGQIKKFSLIKQKKRSITNKYNSLCDGNLIEPLPNPRYSNHLTWINCLILSSSKKVKKVINYLNKKNIETKYFWKPMHLQKIKNNFIIESDMKNTNSIWDRILPLPSSANLKNSQQKRIISILKKYFRIKKQ